LPRARDEESHLPREVFHMKLFNYWRSSSSYRVRLALHFKGVPFEYVPVSLIKGEQHEVGHRAKSPAGYVPVLEVEEHGAHGE